MEEERYRDGKSMFVYLWDPDNSDLELREGGGGQKYLSTHALYFKGVTIILLSGKLVQDLLCCIVKDLTAIRG